MKNGEVNTHNNDFMLQVPKLKYIQQGHHSTMKMWKLLLNFPGKPL